MLPTPTYVQIEPVGQCNLRCKMCPIQFREDAPLHGTSRFMRFDDFTRLIDQFPGLETIHLQGLGEPLLHPRFFDMAEYAINKGIKVTTNTNLTLLTGNRAERFVTSGIEGVYISIDGATQATYEDIRVYGRFQTLLENIQKLVDARNSLQSETPHLRFTMVIMRQNLPELPQLVRLAHQFQICDIFIQQLSHDFGEISFTEKYETLRDYVDSQTLLNEDPLVVQRYFTEARELAEALNVNLRLPRVTPRLHPAGTPGPSRCDWPWRSAYISYQGYAMPCCMVATPDRIHFGNMVVDGVEPVWNNADYNQFRDQLSSDTPPVICQSCSIYKGVF